jgi:predicted ATP-grasp superfamily ATP-dependent carboligase
MPFTRLTIDDEPAFAGDPSARPRMVLALTGWMDGGDVSTGTVERLVEHFDAQPFGQIDAAGFYIDNFPGNMEITAMFRPHVVISDGLIEEFDLASNDFYAATRENLILFVGKEPNLNWVDFADCIFEVARRFRVEQVFFVGSFGGNVPHTREPRLYGTVSDAADKDVLQRFGIRPSTYSGPASFATYLMSQAQRHGVRMMSLVAEIPSYVEGTNPPSITAVTKRLAGILGIQVTLAELRGASDEWESRVSAAVAKDADLAKQIRELEESYDDDLLDTSEAS